jgi:preprotein translocase subunit SecD
MKLSSIGCASLVLALAAVPPALAGPPKLELRLVLQLKSPNATAELSFRTAQVLRRRLDELGVDDPVVTPTGDRINVRMGGVDDPERVHHLLLSNANLELRLVRFPPGGAAARSRDEILQRLNGALPGDVEILEGASKFYAVEKQPIVTGEDFAEVHPGLSQFAQHMLEFTLKPDAAERFGKATGDNVGSALAIVLNGRVVSTPVIRSRITDRGQIEGGFTEVQVQDLATVLRSGPLPAPLVILDEKRDPWPMSRREHSLLIGGLFALVLLVAAGLYGRSQRKNA